MSEGSSRIVTIRLKVARFDRGIDGRMEFACMGCGSSLEVHQPDQDDPDRILGTCERCHGWVIAFYEADEEEGVMLFLPGGDFTASLGIILGT